MIARAAISTKGLVKRYGRVCALDGFTLDVPTGSVLGLVGANGAGKTTWMMCVAGCLRPTAGEIDVLGGGPFDAGVHSGRLAILPQDSELPLEMTPEGLFRTFARLQGMDAGSARSAAERALEQVNLTAHARKPIRSLSHGMRKRVMTGQCFLGDPEAILLDEPMNGLDPEEQARMRDLILRDAGRRTFVLSSHNLSDLQRLCTHIAFVKHGKVARMATVEELTADGVTLEERYLKEVEGLRS